MNRIHTPERSVSLTRVNGSSCFQVICCLQCTHRYSWLAVSSLVSLHPTTTPIHSYSLCVTTHARKLLTQPSHYTTAYTDITVLIFIKWYKYSVKQPVVHCPTSDVSNNCSTSMCSLQTEHAATCLHIRPCRSGHSCGRTCYEASVTNWLQE